MNSMIYEQPPALTGDERAQLQQLYRYLFKLSEQLNTSLEATDRQYRMAIKTRSGSENSDDVFTPALDAKYRELRSLIIKTADIVNQKMDRVVTQLNSEFQAISNEWGTFEQNIERTIIDTAENTIEQFDYSEHIYGIDKTVMDGVTYYGITSLGYIKRGIIGFDDKNFPIYGIAVGTELKEKTVIKDGKEYQQIDTNQRIATYTSDRITFWANGVELAYFSGDKLFVTRVEVTDGITIGDMHIDVNDKNGLSVGKQIGSFIDISENETMVKANRRIALMVDGTSTDTKLVLTDQMLEAIAANINLSANESISLIVGGAVDDVDAKISLIVDDSSTASSLVLTQTALTAIADQIDLSANKTVTITAEQINEVADQIDISGNEYLKLTVKDAVDGVQIGGRNLLLETAAHTVTADTSGIVFGEGGNWVDMTPDVDLQSLIGQELTLSGWFYSPGAYVNTGTTGQSRWDLYTSVYWTDSTGTNAGEKTTWPCYIAGVGAAGERRYATAVITPPAGYDTIARIFAYIDVRIKPASGNSAVWQLKEIKLEKGNKSTDWSPAPEDAEGEIDGLKDRMSSAELKITDSAIVSTVTSSESYNTLSGTANTNAANISALTTRMSTAEQKITDSAIVSTVTQSSEYKTLSGNVTTAQSTANTAKSTADSAKASTTTNASNISALTTRVSTAESKIEQKADSVTLSVLETKVDGIQVGGRNYFVDSKGPMTVSGMVTALQTVHIGKTASIEARQELYDGETTVALSFDWENHITDGYANMIFNTTWQAIKSFDASTPATGHYSYTFVLNSASVSSVNTVYVQGTYTGDLIIRNLKLEKGNKSTDWSPAPEDPAQGLVIGSSVEITKDRVRILSQETSIAIPSADSEDGEEIASFDENGLTAQEATFGTVHSDSVVATQASATLTPANAGELQAILDNLSFHFLTGTVTVDCSGVQGGTFTLRGLSGGYQLNLSDLTANSLTVARCTARIYLWRPTFSTSGTALTVTDAKVYIGDGTINAATGVYVGEWGEVRLVKCGGTTTTLLNVDYGSTAHVSGTEVGVSVPYGLKTGAGDAYSQVAFKAAQSTVATPTVTTAELGATSTKTWCGSWKSGNGLYQGRYISSDSTYRRGCMWFNLSAITGKEIVSASLKIKRYSGVGGGGSVTVNLYGTTAASASGTPGVGTKYASVAIANGQTKTVDVTAAVKALAAGTIKGLMIYDSQSGTFSSGKYTYGYCRIYGSDAADKPVLSVTYK